jgi:membrane fusion protein (multidrug efflux system)
LVSAARGNDQANGAPPSVSVVRAIKKDLKPALAFSGRVEAKDSVQLRARLVGFLEQKLFTEGQEVKAGDLLFVMEQAPYEAVIDQANGAIESEKSELALADTEAKRQDALVAKGAAPQSQLDAALAHQREARGNLTQLQAALESAKLNLGYTEIRAPIDGRIGRFRYSAGNYIGSSREVLATIVTQDPIYVTFSVSQREIIAVRESLGHAEKLGANLDDAVVHIRLANGKQYGHAGKVNFIDVSVDQGTDTVTVRAVFPNPDRILSNGQLVNVIVEKANPETAVFVSQSAIQIDQSGPFALVVNKENKIEIRRLEPGPMVGTELSVTKGLVEGDLIVTEGIQKVRPGELVEPIEIKPTF